MGGGHALPGTGQAPKKNYRKWWPFTSRCFAISLYIVYIYILAILITIWLLHIHQTSPVFNIVIFLNFGLKIWGLKRPNIGQNDFLSSRTMRCTVTKVKNWTAIIFWKFWNFRFSSVWCPKFVMVLSWWFWENKSKQCLNSIFFSTLGVSQRFRV